MSLKGASLDSKVKMKMFRDNVDRLTTLTLPTSILQPNRCKIILLNFDNSQVFSQFSSGANFKSVLSVNSQVVACAVEASSLHHREANASVLKYLFDLLHVGRSKEERQDFAERQALAGKAPNVTMAGDQRRSVVV